MISISKVKTMTHIVSVLVNFRERIIFEFFLEGDKRSSNILGFLKLVGSTVLFKYIIRRNNLNCF